VPPAAGCYTSHPPLDLGHGLKIFGGNCHAPIVVDADIYVALDGAGFRHTPRLWPWHAHPAIEHPAIELVYALQDRAPPADARTFRQLIGWLADAVTAGKKIHIGCIGGHGRTGTVLAALYAALNPADKQAIQHVRAHYCPRAVESAAQVAFLMTHFAVDTAAAMRS
jgi:hypothetical protein